MNCQTNYHECKSATRLQIKTNYNRIESNLNFERMNPTEVTHNQKRRKSTRKTKKERKKILSLFLSISGWPVALLPFSFINLIKVNLMQWNINQTTTHLLNVCVRVGAFRMRILIVPSSMRYDTSQQPTTMTMVRIPIAIAKPSYK